MNKMKGYYRTFKHNLEYKEDYARNILILLFSLIVLDITLLLIVW